MTTPHTCTKDDPWTAEKEKTAVHPDATCVREYDDWFDGSSFEDYECPNCGKKFTVEVPR